MKEQFLGIDKFLGVNLKGREHELVGPTVGQEVPGGFELREAKNFDITDRGRIRGRTGYEKKLALTGAHSGFPVGRKILCGSDAGICLVDVDNWTYEVLVSSVNPDALISWAKVGTRVYWMNGETSGIIEGGVNRDWGIARPGKVTATASSTGGLPAGEYQVALTFLLNGEESGATIATKVTVPELGGISLTSIPQGGDTIRVYVTRQDGDVLFRHSDLPLGTTSFTVTAGALGKRLMTQFANKPPVGHIVREHNGRLFIARGDTIFYTMPQIYSLCRISKDFLPRFPERIKMICPTEGGFYVDAGELYFVSFPNAESPALVEELGSDYSVIEGTDREVPAFWFGVETPGNVGFWWTERGWPVVGGPEGAIRPLGEDKLAIPKYEFGATLLREREGLKQLISAFRFDARDSNFAVSDSLEVTVNYRGQTA